MSARRSLGEATSSAVPEGEPAPRRRRATAGYTLADLAGAAGVTPRTVRLYVEERLLPAPVFRGRSTTYGEEHLHRLLAVVRLREDKGLRLNAIRRHLADLSPAEIAELAAPPPSKASAPAPSPPAGGDEAADDALADGAEAWRRVPLLPGLELHLRSDATPLVRRLAAEIRARYGAQAAK